MPFKRRNKKPKEGRVVAEGETYKIIATAKAFDGRAILCKTCKLTSYNHNDVKCLYCDKCKKFHVP